MIRQLNLRTSGGRWLTRWDPAVLRERTGASIAPLTRAELHDVLLRALPDDIVQLGTQVTTVPDADLVVAADGIDSHLRGQLWPDLPPPVPNGVATWRGIAPTPASAPVLLTNSWGIGTEFGTAPLPDGRAYWWAALPTPTSDTSGDERAAVLRHFGHFHDPIPELLRTTDQVLRLDIRHLSTPPPSYVTDRVALLGDAAHAMPPDLGQGGGMAIEDAVVLADALTRTPDIPAALARYDAQRRPRATAIDYRLYLPQLEATFLDRGGRVEVRQVADAALVELGTRHDVVVVASGRGPLAQSSAAVPNCRPTTGHSACCSPESSTAPPTESGGRHGRGANSASHSAFVVAAAVIDDLASRPIVLPAGRHEALGRRRLRPGMVAAFRISPSRPVRCSSACSRTPRTIACRSREPRFDRRAKWPSRPCGSRARAVRGTGSGRWSAGGRW